MSDSNSAKWKWCFWVFAGSTILHNMRDTAGVVIREIGALWPVEDTWEARLETAMYSYGVLTLMAATFVGFAIILCVWLVKRSIQNYIAEERALRQQSEAEFMEKAGLLMQAAEKLGGEPVKKSESSVTRAA